MYNGYTNDIPERQQLTNELATICGFLKAQPYNTYWQNRRADCERKIREYDMRDWERFVDELEQMELDNLYNPNGQDRDGELTGISQPVIF